METISFEKLKGLVNSLDQFQEAVVEKKYASCRDARAVLQAIKIEAQDLREAINNYRKS